MNQDIGGFGSNKRSNSSRGPTFEPDRIVDVQAPVVRAQETVRQRFDLLGGARGVEQLAAHQPYLPAIGAQLRVIGKADVIDAAVPIVLEVVELLGELRTCTCTRHSAARRPSGGKDAACALLAELADWNSRVRFLRSGTALHRLLRRSSANIVVLYDKFLTEHSGAASFERLRRSDLVFVTVPTPYDESREACDLRSVRDVVDRLDVPICIKSTVPPGTIAALIAETGKTIAYSPEYIGERPGHQWPEADSAGSIHPRRRPDRVPARS